MEQETMIDLLRYSTHVSFDDADRIRVPTLIRGVPGAIEYRGMPWLRWILALKPNREIMNHRVDMLSQHMV